jgi:hypothetical protein
MAMRAEFKTDFPSTLPKRKFGQIPFGCGTRLLHLAYFTKGG